MWLIIRPSNIPASRKHGTERQKSESQNEDLAYAGVTFFQEAKTKTATPVVTLTSLGITKISSKKFYSLTKV